MTTYKTGNPIGSTDARDRLDNSENLDLAVNSLSQTFVDRLGVTRDTLEGIYQKSAYYRVGTYRDWETDRKSTRLNSSHSAKSRMPSSA